MLSKKCTSLFLSILLLVSNFGFAINVHYCGNQIASISSAFSTLSSVKVETQSKACCCVVIKKDKDSCCKSKLVDLKKETKDVIVKTFSFQIQTPFLPAKSSELIFAKAERLVSGTHITGYYCSPNAPPLFKLYKQYIFYA